MRTVVLGGPGTGKTTTADAAGRSTGTPVLHTDDLIPGRTWSAVSDVVAGWLDRAGPWIIEGVAAVRALRKWLDANPDGAPCDRVLYLARPPFRPPSRGQASMAAGIETIWREIEPELRARGVEVSWAA